MENIIIIICYIIFLASIWGTIYNAKKGNFIKAFLISNGVIISIIIIKIMNYIYGSYHYGPSGPINADIIIHNAPAAKPFIFMENFLEEYLGYIMIAIAIILVITAIISVVININKKIKFGRVLTVSIFSIFIAILEFLHLLINQYVLYFEKFELVILLVSYYLIILNILFSLNGKKAQKI